uniref:Collagen triple helix repeat domain containing protein n=1 Tax=Haemonchus contortus TaxID=6289 RepID=W6NPP2_HAECO
MQVVLVYVVLVGLLVCTTDTTLARELQRSYRGFFEPGEDPGDYMPPQGNPEPYPNEGFGGPPDFPGGEGGPNGFGMQGEVGGPDAPDGPGGPGWPGAESGFGSPFGSNGPDGPAGSIGGVDQDPQRNLEGPATAATVELVKEQILEY